MGRIILEEASSKGEEEGKKRGSQGEAKQKQQEQMSSKGKENEKKGEGTRRTRRNGMSNHPV